MSDLISKKQALALVANLKLGDISHDNETISYDEALNTAIEAIEALPCSLILKRRCKHPHDCGDMIVFENYNDAILDNNPSNSDDKLVEALERCIKIVEVNNWRQAEKVDDVIHVARAAIDNHAKSILKDKGAR